jgi:hypothetical protein
MKSVMKTLFLALILGLMLAMTACSKKEEPNKVQDINAVRAELKAQVERGKLTREEAIVRLAEAQVKYGSDKEEKDRELSPELEALGEELKGKVAKGEMTADEGKDAWYKAAGKTEDSKDSEKDKK